MIGYSAGSDFEPTTDRPTTFGELLVALDHRRCAAIALNDFYAFFDGVADAMDLPWGCSLGMETSRCSVPPTVPTSTTCQTFQGWMPRAPDGSCPPRTRMCSLFATGFEREAGPAAPDVVVFLRRLAAALEAHAVFRDPADADTRRAAAFIAAESLSLTTTMNGVTEGEAPAYRLLRSSVFQATEAALLYVIAGLESNGALTLVGIDDLDRGADTAEAIAGEDALDMVAALVRLRPTPRTVDESGADDDETLTAGVRRAAFIRLGNAAAAQLRWLRTGDDERPDDAVIALEQSVQILDSVSAARYADLQHLSRLVLLVIKETEARALCRVPRPTDERYLAYIRARSSSRPLIWPSGTEYVSQCLPGPHQHAAVALPTGSGKSFIAELAVSQALLYGWVLYLVPTNALAVQVRRDLTAGIQSLEGATVRAFVGGLEYTELPGEAVADVEPGTVLVMTPEKCALALRRSPEAFATLRLCVFDECHLISEAGGRGALAEPLPLHPGHLASGAVSAVVGHDREP